MLFRRPRLKTLLKVQVRAAHRWNDAIIVNQSSGGLGLRCEFPPRVGEMIELLRGRCWARVRVAWSHGDRFGVDFPHASQWIGESMREKPMPFDLCSQSVTAEQLAG